MSSSRTPTPKKRKHRRGASEMGKLFMTLFEDKKKAPVSRTTAQDAEELTREERLSRMLHTPKPKVRLPTDVPLFEHFIVVGLANHTASDPTVLFHYPNTPVGIPGVEDFCFPRGVQMEVMKPTTCKSNLMEVKHNQDYLKCPEHSFVFLLTNEDSTVYYGICVHKKELIEDAPYYMDGPLIPEKFHASTVRCYCLITKYPFFRLHLDLLHSLFAVEHLTRLVEEAPQKGDPPVVRLPTGATPPPAFKRSSTVSSLSRSADLRTMTPQRRPETRADRLQRRRENSRSSSVSVDLTARKVGPVRPVSPTTVLEKAGRSRIRSLEKDPACQSPGPNIRSSKRQYSDLSDAPSSPYRVAKDDSPIRETPADAGDANGVNSSPARQLSPDHEDGTALPDKPSTQETVDVLSAPDGDAVRTGEQPLPSGVEEKQQQDEEKATSGEVVDQAGSLAGGQEETKVEKEPATAEGAEGDVQMTAAAPRRPGGHARTKSPLEDLVSLEELEAPALQTAATSPLQRCKAARTRSHSQPVKMRPLRPGDPNHPALDALERYRTTPVPQKGQTLAFETSVYLNSIQFTRPYFDEEEEIFAEWGLPLTFFTLSISNICHLLSSILLEKKVVLLSSNIRYLSALVLSFPPLIRPFLYQSVIIPALPVKMHNFLDAPVPFVVGLTELPVELPDDVIVVNVDKNKVIAKEPIPRLPGYKDLIKKCNVYHEQLKKTFGKSPPFTTTKEQMSLVDSLSTVFETFFTKMFTNFHNYTMRNLTDPSKPISVFMKDAFLFDHPHESFLTPFVETQVFFDYQDKRLRKRDKFKLPTQRDVVF